MYIGGLICLVITDAGQLVVPELTKIAVNAIAGSRTDAFHILKICLIMAAVSAFVAVGRFGWRYFITGSARRIENGLRAQLFSHILKMDPSFFEERKTGEIMARLTNDLRAVRSACGMAVVSVFDGIFMAAFILVLLFVEYPSLTGWIIIPLLVLCVIVAFGGKFIAGRTRRVQEGFASVSAIAQEILSGIRVYKTFSSEDFAVKRFAEANSDYMDRSMSLVRIMGLFFPLINFLAGITTLLLLYFGGSQIIYGTMTPGDFAAVLIYLNLLVWPMMSAGFSVNWIQRGAASLSRIGELLDTEPEIIRFGGSEIGGEVSGNVSGDACSDKPGGDIEFRHLCFSHDERKPVLEDISFRIPEGASVGIFGKTGSGKSSIINLIPRFHDPPPGSIFLGGRDIREYDLYKLRESIGIVQQESFLFSDTIRENIRFAAPWSSEEEILEAAEFSTISRDLKEFPLGLDTMVGEKGHRLSGGQKQRIAISRTFLTNPEVLIFDDCLSAVDAETEAGIIDGFLEKRRGRTSIIVSNRTATLAFTDFIIVIENGRIAAAKPHEELIEMPGLYRKIYRLQQSVSIGGKGEV